MAVDNMSFSFPESHRKAMSTLRFVTKFLNFQVRPLDMHLEAKHTPGLHRPLALLSLCLI